MRPFLRKRIWSTSPKLALAAPRNPPPFPRPWTAMRAVSRVGYNGGGRFCVSHLFFEALVAHATSRLIICPSVFSCSHKGKYKSSEETLVSDRDNKLEENIALGDKTAAAAVSVVRHQPCECSTPRHTAG